MDLSEAYVIMCREADEVQAAWKIDFIGDHVYEKKLKYHAMVTDADKTESANRTVEIFPLDKSCVVEKSWKDDLIWLPYQDQLQSMLDGSIYDKIELFNQTFLKPLGVIRIDVESLGQDKIEEFKKAFHESMSSPKPVLITTESETQIKHIDTGEFSFEMLWLILVMREKFHKKWNAEDKKWDLVMDDVAF